MLSRINFDDAVQAALLFGSRSRGDAVEGSDIDIAVFAVAKSPAALIETKRSLATQCPQEPVTNFSVYSVETAHAMALQGSLYLWHLKLEGTPILDKGFLGSLFGNLRRYSCAKAADDIATFRQVLRDVQRALAAGGETLPFEAATAFSVLRSLGMMLSALRGDFVFSRTGPIDYLRRALGERFCLTGGQISELLRAKLSYSGKSGNAADLSLSGTAESVARLMEILEVVGELTK